MIRFKGLGFAGLVGLVSFAGCGGTDNESFLRAQADANASKDTGNAAAPPATQAAYHQQQQQAQAKAYSKQSGYPGAKN